MEVGLQVIDVASTSKLPVALAAYLGMIADDGM